MSLLKITAAACGAAMAQFASAWAVEVAEAEPDTSRLRRLMIQSEILDETRPIDIYLPRSYDSSDEAYSVIYVLDGEASFHYAAGVIDALYQRGYPKMLLAVIPNTSRSRDLTPEAWGDDAQSGGGADNFTKFFADELIPAIDERFRTQHYRVLVGHSFGGLFASHVLATRPDLFGGYIAISPSMDFAEHRPLAALKRSFADRRDDARLRPLYVAVGNEPGGEGDSVHQLYSMLAADAPAWLNWRFRIFPDEDHSSVPVIATLQGLRFMFEGFVLEGREIPSTVAGLKTHYEEVSRRFGWTVNPPQRVLMNLGYRQLEWGRTADAVETFKLYAKLHPDAVPGWEGLSYAYEQQGKKTAAIAAMKKVIEVAPWYEEARLRLEALEREMAE